MSGPYQLRDYHEAPWTKTRAQIAGIKRKNPHADVRALQEKLAREVALDRASRKVESAIRELSEATLTENQRSALAEILDKENGGAE